MKKYRVTTWVTGINFGDKVETFKEQVELRPELRNSDVYIDAPKKLIINTPIEGYSDDEVSKVVSEEVWELCSAILKNMSGLDVEIVEIEETR